MGKASSKFVCQNCGYESRKWLGQCSECNSWGSMLEESDMEVVSGKVDMQSVLEIKTMKSISSSTVQRFSSGIVEFDRVLGKSGQSEGFVEGQVILLSGEPGIGKSTLLLQVLFNNVLHGMDTIYISAEESEGQISLRADRLISNNKKLDKEKLSNLRVASAFNVEGIIEAVRKEKPKCLIIDSIQTIFSVDSRSIPGSVSQVKICANKLVNYAKSENVILIIVGHITKDGVIAGPKLLEHLVDTVLQLEGDEKTGVRIIRSLKNRFGQTNEVGLFEMSSGGLMDLSNPTQFLVSEGSMIGVCRSVAIEGSRPVIIEVQSLLNNTPFSLPKRVSEGIPVARMQRIAAILSRYSKLQFADKDIYIKISGNLKVDDPGIDLAIALSLYSSYKNKGLSPSCIAFGELNLTGRIGKVIRNDDRSRESKRHGFTSIISGETLQSVDELGKLF